MKCINHYDIDAVGVCVRCGKGLCIDCKRELGGKIHCQTCADEIFTQKTAPPVTSPRPEAPGALVSLILSIVGFFFWPLGIVLGPIALHYANKAKAELRKHPEMGGGSMATAGFIIGIIATILGVIFVLVIIVSILIPGSSEPSTISH
jgi:hypothetical protein